MRDYGRIAPTFWTRGSGRRLRGNPVAQVVAAYLCSAPGTNAIGLFYAPVASIANDTGLSVEQVRSGLAAVEAAGFAFYDAAVDLAYVPNGAEQQIGEELTTKDRRRTMVEKELKRFGRHRFVSMFLERYGDAYTLAPFADKFRNPIHNSGEPSHEFEHASVPVPVPDLASESEGGPQGAVGPVSVPPRRLNPVVLVEHFASGVNATGGVWVCSRGKQSTDLADALQPHATKPLPTGLDVTGLMRTLGRRWFAYCNGAPRDPWKAAAWLGEGAPETKPSLVGAPPANEAQKRAAEARRAAESRKRDEEYAARKRERQSGPPPEVAALVAGVLREEPASGTRIRPAHEQLEELMRLEGEETGS